MNAQAVVNQLNDKIETQRYRYHKLLGSSVAVPCKGSAEGNSARVAITNNLDGDYVIEEIRIKAYGPCDVNGIVPQTLSVAGYHQTDFPSGVSVSSAATATQKAESGVTVKIVDAATRRELTDGFMPLECMISPAYGDLKVLPAWKHVLKKQTDLVFEFRNRDTAKLDSGATAYHWVEVSLHGDRHDGIVSAE